QFIDLDTVMRALRKGAEDTQADWEVGKLKLLCLGMVPLAAIAYPLLQAIVMRWWLEGLRIGPLAVTTTLRKRSIIGAYLRWFLYAALVVIVVLIAVGVAVDSTQNLKVSDDVSDLAETGTGVGVCLVMVLGVWVLHQTTVKLRI